VPLWIRVQQDGRWADPSYADVIVTDLRVLCRMGAGRLTSLWWAGVAGLHIDSATEHVILDFGDGQPVCLTGPAISSLAVVGIASVYGGERCSPIHR
jgi:hypothetical protein